AAAGGTSRPDRAVVASASAGGGLGRSDDAGVAREAVGRGRAGRLEGLLGPRAAATRVAADVPVRASAFLARAPESRRRCGEGRRSARRRRELVLRPEVAART